MSSGEVYAVMVKDGRAYLADVPLHHSEVTAENLRELTWSTGLTRTTMISDCMRSTRRGECTNIH